MNMPNGSSPVVIACALAALFCFATPSTSVAQKRAIPASVAYKRLISDYGEEAERRFVRAFRHLDRDEFRELSTEFLQKREAALRRYLNKYPLAKEAHAARIMLAHTLLYRESDTEAQSLLNMVILTTNDSALEFEARFTLVKLYRRTDPVKAQVALKEIADKKKAPDEVKARACYELGTILEPETALPVLKRGAAMRDGKYQRLCRKRLTKLTVVDRGSIQPNREAPTFETTSVIGKAIKTSDLEDKVYIVHFWTRATPDHTATRALIGALRMNHHGRGLTAIGVNLDRDVERLAQSQRAGQLPWDEVGDKWGDLSEAAIAFAPQTVPLTVLVDRLGIIRFIGRVTAPESATNYRKTALWKATAIAVRGSNGN